MDCEHLRVKSLKKLALAGETRNQGQFTTRTHALELRPQDILGSTNNKVKKINRKSVALQNRDLYRMKKREKLRQISE